MTRAAALAAALLLIGCAPVPDRRAPPRDPILTPGPTFPGPYPCREPAYGTPPRDRASM